MHSTAHFMSSHAVSLALFIYLVFDTYAEAMTFPGKACSNAHLTCTMNPSRKKKHNLSRLAIEANSNRKVKHM